MDKRKIISSLIGLLTFLPLSIYSQSAATDQLLEKILPGEPWDRSVLFSPKTVVFNKTGGDATEIKRVTLSYFTSANCSGAVTGFGSYTTPIGTNFPITNNVPFGLTSEATWNTGENHLGITMTTVQSVAVFLKSTDNTVPQADFTNSACGTNPSFCCVPVICSNGECLPSVVLAAQDFVLKTTSAVGDPAEGGVIACSVAAGDSFDLIAPAADNSTSIKWDPHMTLVLVGASSNDDGMSNTNAIVSSLGNILPYAARTCQEYTTTGGFVTGWFLPAINQLTCLFDNQTAIGGFTGINYWSSTEFNINLAQVQQFDQDAQIAEPKGADHFLRCVRSFTL